MNKKSKTISIAILILIVAVIGTKVYVNNRINNVDWKEANKKMLEQDRQKEDSINKIHQDENQNEHQNSNDYKSIGELFVPFNNDWSIQAEVNDPKIGLYYTVLASKKDESMISISSQKPHEYIEGLEKLADYYNEKFVRNLGASGILLKSKYSIDNKFRGIDAIYEFYDATYVETGEINTCIAVNMIYKGNIYTIFYLETPESQKIIGGIYLNNNQ
ncbi:MAG: hypothetical protein R2797_01915 [Gelidibacter sp.]